MQLWAIEAECDDAFYGWKVEYLFISKEHAEIEMKRLAELNKGINYQITEWHTEDSL